MGTSKACDMVNHKELLTSMHQQGVSGPTWHLFANAYNNIKFVDKWKREVSGEFYEWPGIRQGGASSAGAFNINSDPSLQKLEDHPNGFRVGYINIGAVKVADDLALISPSRSGMQALVYISLSKMHPEDGTSSAKQKPRYR